ncbi:endonuclease NucS [Candidatus Bathyarchaeota archaeon]|nr:endonuclease NucS [Candidatus Bathyarchaeota archaeon]
MTIQNDFSILSNPSTEDACQVVKKALSQHRNLIIVGKCHVEYLGRARSILDPGDRVILVKSDGAVLVHRTTGSEPVNWQPSGCVFKTTLSKGVLVLEAMRRSPVESLVIYFSEIEALIVAKLIDVASFNLHVSERELQKAVLIEPKLLLPDLKPVAYEKKVEPGFIDIYGLDSKNRLVVAELKRVRAGKAAVLQLAKYVECVKKTTPLEVRGILAAPKIAKGVQGMLYTLGLEFVSIDLEKCVQLIVTRRDRKMVDFLI